MIGKHFVATLIPVGFLVIAATVPAEAEVLSLDCTNVTTGYLDYHIWIDTATSNSTWQSFTTVPPTVETDPAQVTVTSFNWSHSFGDGTLSFSLDRTTGSLHVTHSAVPFNLIANCVRGTTQLPATKF